jgi:hypothetical protein
LSRPIERVALKSYALGAPSDKTEGHGIRLGKVLLKKRRLLAKIRLKAGRMMEKTTILEIPMESA